MPLLFALAQQTSSKPEGEAPWMGFVIALVVTVLLLALDVWSGKTARRRPHVVLACVTLVALAVAIYFAERVGSYWTFPKGPLNVHLGLAYAATILALCVALSGVLHLYGKAPRKVHAAIAWLFVAGVIAATATGVWIFTVGEPKV